MPMKPEGSDYNEIIGLFFLEGKTAEQALPEYLDTKKRIEAIKANPA